MTAPVSATLEALARELLAAAAEAAALERREREDEERGSLLLTVAQVANELQCSRATVTNLITRGETRGGLPSVRLGERGDAVRVPRAALIRWVEREARLSSDQHHARRASA